MSAKTPETLKAERGKLFSDFYNNIIPERMPVTLVMPHLVVAQWKGIDPLLYQFDYSMLAPALEEAADLIYTDNCPFNPVGATSRPPMYYGLLGSNSFRMSEAGFMQHPEVVGMMDDEYPDLIEDPLKCLLTKIVPRQYENLDFVHAPFRAYMAMEMAGLSVAEDTASLLPTIGKIKAKKGYYAGAPMGSVGFTAAPFDFLADQLRSFSGVSADVRRKKDLIREVCEVLLPYMFNMGLPKNPHPEGFVSMPLHMPPFMRRKDAEELWFPTFKRLLEQFAARGVRVSAFAEADWSRYLDLLRDLPAATKLKFEDGDPKEVKEALGDKMILSGFYPLSLIQGATLEKCIAKAEELLDVMLPGGGYIFDTAKVPMNLSDVNLENYKALSEFLRDYAVYPEHGCSYGRPLNSENFAVDEDFGAIDSSVFEDLFGAVTFRTESVKPETRKDEYARAFAAKITKLFV